MTSRRPLPNMGVREFMQWVFANWPKEQAIQFSVQDGTFTDNSPGAGSVAWASAIVQYGGQSYRIDDGNTSNGWIYWQLATPTVFATSASFPSLGDDEILVGKNVSGTYSPLWKVGQPVPSDALEVSSLDEITNIAGTIVNGTFNGVTVRTAATGARVEMNSANGIIGIDASAQNEWQAHVDGKLKAKRLYSITYAQLIEMTSTDQTIFLDTDTADGGSLKVANDSGGIEVSAVSTNHGSSAALKLTGTSVSVSGDSIIIAQTQSPASDGTGTAGEIAWDGTYLYVCVATDTWGRVALTLGY